MPIPLPKESRVFPDPGDTFRSRLFRFRRSANQPQEAAVDQVPYKRADGGHQAPRVCLYFGLELCP